MTHKLFRLPCACLAALACALLADAQVRGNEDRPSVATQGGAQHSAPPADASEDFDLNIGERRITEADYEASLTVALGQESARSVNLRVGVAVSAGRIDVLLRNVRGHVRFRATLGQVLRRLEERRAAGAPSVEAPANPSP